MSNNLNTTNPQNLIYQNNILKLTALGGIKIDGLDRMRVTLKVQLINSPTPPVRHNLDLYNDTQLEKFIRKVSERLEIATTVIAASLAELTEQLEQYRLQEIKNRTPDIPKRPTLGADERKAALAFLKDRELMNKTILI